MRHARFPALVLAAVLTATACTGSGADPEPTPSATASESASATPSPTPTASAMDLSAPPPDEVTEEYVQAVLEAIYEVEAEVIRREVAAAENGATTPPEDAVELLSTIYDGDQLVFALRDIGNEWEGGELQVDFVEDADSSLIQATELVDAAEGCIITTFSLDRSPTLEGQAEIRDMIALLQRKPDDADPQGVNPSPWVIVQQGIMNPDVEAACGS